MNPRRLVGLVAIAMVVFSSRATAISIDNLALDRTKPVNQQVPLPSARQVVTSAGPVSTTNSTITNAEQVIGRTRFVQVQVAGGFNVTSAIDNGFLSHSQDANTKGSSFIVWDGNPAAGIQPTGLGGVDITQDDATGIRTVIEAYDFATSQPLKLTYTVYDASDPTGAKKVSAATLTLNSAIATTTSLLLPFSSFKKLDTAAEPANLKNIGAITLLIDGSLSVSHDIILSFIGTNGRCDHVPVNRLVLDQCGVCNGSNNTCSDCNGVPNGPAVAGAFCSTGSLGVCGNGVLVGKFPSCGCTQSDKPGFEICDGIDNDCDGAIDNGAPNKGPLLDACGVCGGDGKSCADCKGVPNGPAKTDPCGICGGDGGSCVTCSSVDQSELLRQLDGGAKAQEGVVIRIAALLRSLPQGRREATFISKTLQQAHKLQIRNWVLSYSLPLISTSCTNSTASICTTSSNTSILNEYRLHNTELRDLALALLKKVNGNRSAPKSAKSKSLNQAAIKEYRNNLANSKSVPEVQIACLGK